MSTVLILLLIIASMSARRVQPVFAPKLTERGGNS